MGRLITPVKKEKSEKIPDVVLKARATRHPLAICTPRDDRVVIRRDEGKKESAGGILLPDSAAPKENTGIVVAIGPGRQTVDGKYIPIEVVPGVLLKLGDRVIITSFAGLELRGVDRKDSEFFILRAEDILATLPEE